MEISKKINHIYKKHVYKHIPESYKSGFACRTVTPLCNLQLCIKHNIIPKIMQYPLKISFFLTIQICVFFYVLCFLPHKYVCMFVFLSAGSECSLYTPFSPKPVFLFLTAFSPVSTLSFSETASGNFPHNDVSAPVPEIIVRNGSTPPDSTP